MEVLERGDICFFFRPTVQPEDAVETTLGVQSFFMVLGPARGRHRRVRIGKKRLPERSGERFWARVERVGSMQRVVGDQLEDERYTTKTRGERYQPGARAIGQGSYEFVRHDDHVHFTYQLDHLEPDAPEPLHIADAGDYVVLFENEEKRRRPVWTAAGDPSQLDAEGTEIVIVGHSDCSHTGRRNHGEPEMVE
jgi:hypothetical protein